MDGRNEDIFAKMRTTHYTSDRMVVAKKVDSKELPTQKVATPIPPTCHKVFDASPIVLFDDAMKNDRDAVNHCSSSVEGICRRWDMPPTGYEPPFAVALIVLRSVIEQDGRTPCGTPAVSGWQPFELAAPCGRPSRPQP